MKRVFGILKVVILCSAMAVLSVFAMAEGAEQQKNNPAKVIKSTKLDISNGANSARLLDDDIYTRVKFGEKTAVKVKADSPIFAVYLVFDGPLVGYNFSYGDYVVTQGADGFLHDYKAIASPVNEILFEFNAGTIITDIYILGEGDVPDWVQVWEKPLAKADMLVLPTHHDDEILFFGGTMPVYSQEKGKKVQVAYMNNHWGEPFRPHEALDGLWLSGIRNYPIIPDFKDIKFYDLKGALNFYKEDVLVEYYVSLIRRFKPDVIVGHDFGGEYGHGSHMASAYAVSKAIEVSNSPEKYLASANTFGTWDVKKTYLHLYEKNKIVMEWDVPLKAFGGKTGFEVATIALDAHASQRKYYAMSKKGVYDCRQFGLYRSTVGDDVKKDDFFENVPISEEKTNLSLRQEVVLQTQNSPDDSKNNGISNSNENLGKNKKEDFPCFDGVNDFFSNKWVIIGTSVLGIIALIVVVRIIYIIRKKGRKS